jgi:hypothetical protein
MGFLDKLKQAAGVHTSLRIIEPNAGTGIDLEWLHGRFSSMVVGESHRTEDFANAYAPCVWPEGSRRVNQEVRDMVTVELRRDPSNAFDGNAIEVWSVGSPRSPYSWHAGFLHRDVASRVAPFVDSVGVHTWRHPAEIRGTVSLKTPKFGVTLIPGRLLTRGPDMSGLADELNLSYRPPTEKQIDFVLSLLGAERDMGDGVTMSTQLSKQQLDLLLARVGNPPDWKSRTTWSRLDSHQIGVAIDVLKGGVLW